MLHFSLTIQFYFIHAAFPNTPPAPLTLDSETWVNLLFDPSTSYFDFSFLLICV